MHSVLGTAAVGFAFAVLIVWLSPYSDRWSRRGNGVGPSSERNAIDGRENAAPLSRELGRTAARAPERSPWARDPLRDWLKGWAFFGWIFAVFGAVGGPVVLWSDHSLALITGWLVCLFVAFGGVGPRLRVVYRKRHPSDEYLRARATRDAIEREAKQAGERMMNRVQAFRAVTLFLEQYLVHGGNELGLLMHEIGFDKWGSTTNDPAAWFDWMKGVQTVGDEASVVGSTPVAGELLDEHGGFRAMTLFLHTYADRGGRDLLTLVRDAAPGPDGVPSDPSLSDDWNRSFQTVADEVRKFGGIVR